MTEQEKNAAAVASALVSEGVTLQAACGVLGNLEAESGIIPCRMQGDYGGPTFQKSHEYADKVDSGFMSCEEFAKDGIGWGIYQLTYWTRKAEFYSLAQNTGRSIADITAQLQMMVKELKRDYPVLWSKMKNPARSLKEIADLFCSEFERPAVNNFSVREASAQKWYDFLSRQDIEEITAEAGPHGTQRPSVESWPPRTVDAGIEGWPEVWLLQSLLKAHGYPAMIDGIFGKSLDEKLRAFQRDSGLQADGVCGPMTWRALGVET